MLAAAQITFDPTFHEYRLPDGTRVPSVTEVLRETGISVDFEALASSSPRIGAAIDLKRELGHALHADAHAYDDDDLVWASVDPRVEPYLRAWATFRENSALTPTTRERLVFHPVFQYAGTLDGLFRQPDGGLVLLDLKTGDPTSSGCQYQTAAYLAAYRLEHRELDAVPIARWGVQLTPETRVPYRVSPYTAWDDFSCFQAFLTTYRRQAARRTHGAR